MLTKSFLKKTKEKLLNERQELTAKSTVKPDIDTDGDETDEVQGNILLEIQNQLNIRNRSKLSQITEALKRIEDKTYGACQECGEDIPEKRLLINPYFLNCIGCVETQEAEDKQRKRS
jgi:DnaK suppressor protein